MGPFVAGFQVLRILVSSQIRIAHPGRLTSAEQRHSQMPMTCAWKGPRSDQCLAAVLSAR